MKSRLLISARRAALDPSPFAGALCCCVSRSRPTPSIRLFSVVSTSSPMR